MNFTCVSIAAALLAGSASAMAVTYNIGTMPIAPTVYNNAASVPVGSFSDRYDFMFPVLGSTASASAVSIQLAGLLDIRNLMVELFDSSNTLLASGAPGMSSSVSNIALTGGSNYYYMVTGTATGLVGGAYAFIASASAVPEPSTYAMMIAGIGAVGFLALRRRQRS
jgi:PEP-CTERM motif